ncbi:Allergen Fus c 3 [Madurella mycetomatis]|uniref:Allergen Fus c 3 n=1 Tax=Madurella mycetomatis TaxID=100816 RepID=A0A175VVL9_9PEZI|nr:Allergen Fus c 3 [Madurella mycetomatis]
MATGGPSGFGPGDPDRPHQTTLSANRSLAGHSDLHHPPDVLPAPTTQPAFSALTYSTLRDAASTLDDLAVSWRPIATSNTLYSSASSPAILARPSAELFEYASQLNAPNYAGDCVAPTALQDASQQGLDIMYAWPGTGDSSMSLSTPDPGSLTSPFLRSYEMLAQTSEHGISDSEATGYVKPEAVESWQQQQRQPGQDAKIEASPHKRAKKSSGQDVASASATLQAAPMTAGAGGSKTKLRSASRASRNVQHRPEETPQERRSRNSHNLVEKQYRNRLNMQFEVLMNTLPEAMRSPTGGGGGGGGGDSDGGPQQALDLGERRLSKAQVLDMSARYIRSLERERDKLESEREGLLADIQKMSDMFLSDGSRGGAPGNWRGPGGATG